MTKKFIFRHNQSIGAAQAELDARYLSECFIDTGDLDILSNCEDPRRIISGRTGSGKSALISRIQEVEENVVQIRPEALALTYISNSGVINFFTEAGVKMDIFYRLLWRHIFVVEILKVRFHITSEESKKGFLNTLWQLVPKKKQHELALDYLRTWGESFWQETEYRVREVTAKLEKELTGSVTPSLFNIGPLNATAARKLTEEQRQEVIHRAQEIVNKVQIADLSRVIDLLDEVLIVDPQKKYYILIDKLDEDWIEDRLRFRLIRALIETTLDFVRVRNVKIILAIRNDLLDRVYRYTRDPGFQEEKYRTSTLQIRWTRPQLINLLDARINLMVREQYTIHVVTHEDLLPKKMGKKKTIDYMLDRTLMRPRDIIQFFNVCINLADGETLINQRILNDAEGVYSRERLRALADEWNGLYPNLLHLVELLKRREQTFFVKDISEKQIIENYLELLVSGRGEDGLDLELMKLAFEGSITYEDYLVNLILIFYKVGLVGIKTDPYTRFSWSDSGGISVSSAEIHFESKIAVHPTFWRCLGVDFSEDEAN
jgi:hypothetical protein